jgi:hypothetical protein
MKWVLLCFGLSTCGNLDTAEVHYYNTKQEYVDAALKNNEHVQAMNSKEPVWLHTNNWYGCTEFIREPQ